MKNVYALHNTFLGQTCGVGELGIFRFPPVAEWNEENKLSLVQPKGGCGWVIVSFTKERPEYEEAYKQLCQRWKLIYQSPVRRNNRTNRDFFFCIFDSRSKP